MTQPASNLPANPANPTSPTHPAVRQLRMRIGEGWDMHALLPFVSAVVLAVEKEVGQIRVEWGSDW